MRVCLGYIVTATGPWWKMNGYDWQVDRKAERQTDSQTQMDTQSYRNADRQSDTHGHHGHTVMQTDSQTHMEVTVIQKWRQTDRTTDRQCNRQTNRKTETCLRCNYYTATTAAKPARIIHDNDTKWAAGTKCIESPTSSQSQTESYLTHLGQAIDFLLSTVLSVVVVIDNSLLMCVQTGSIIRVQTVMVSKIA